MTDFGEKIRNIMGNANALFRSVDPKLIESMQREVEMRKSISRTLPIIEPINDTRPVVEQLKIMNESNQAQHDALVESLNKIEEDRQKDRGVDWWVNAGIVLVITLLGVLISHLLS